MNNTRDHRDRGERRDRGDREGRGGDRDGRGRRFGRPRKCFFCENNVEPDYKTNRILRRFVSERGKILPRRTTATCAIHQRGIALSIKRARAVALLPFVAENMSK